MKTSIEAGFAPAPDTVPAARSLSSAAMTGQLQRSALNGPTMGTRWSAVFYATAATPTGIVQRALQSTVDEVDRQMSTWKPDSALNALNRAPPGTRSIVPPELASVLALGLEVGAQSAGAFDIGAGDLIDAWGFGPPRREPDPQAIAALGSAARQPAGALLTVDPMTGMVSKLGPVQLDLSGIAKGFGVDQLARALEQFGIDRYLVSIDGELRTRGLKPGGEAWRVALERPASDAREPDRILEVGDGALATSGDYRHSAIYDNQHISHSMDPRTGRPVSNRIASVTVAAATCVLADAWATALLVLGEDDGPRVAAQFELSAQFIIRNGEAYRLLAVGHFA